MALADAVVFWNTLTRIFQSDTELVLVFVSALSVGAVAVCHVIGRLTRSRIEGHRGSISWMLVLTLLWLSLGLMIGGMRAFGTTGVGGLGSGKLADTAADPAPVDWSAVQVAGLFLALYLLTGVLTITHAYQYGDPRSAALRAAHRRRQALVQELAEARFNTHIAQGLATLRNEDLGREQAARDREHELNDAWGGQLRAQSRQDTARHLHDAAATDGLTQQDEPPAAPATTTQQPADPPPADPPPPGRGPGDPGPADPWAPRPGGEWPGQPHMPPQPNDVGPDQPEQPAAPAMPEPDEQYERREEPEPPGMGEPPPPPWPWG